MVHCASFPRTTRLLLAGLCSTLLLACDNTTPTEEPIFVVEEPDPLPDFCEGYTALPVDRDALSQVPPGEVATVKLVDRFEVEHPEGFSEDLCLSVPDNILSLAVTIEGSDRLTYALNGWQGPGGFEIVRPGWNTQGQGLCSTNCNNRIYARIGAFAALAPNNPASRVEPGRHILSVEGRYSSSPLAAPQPRDGSVKVTIHARVVGDEVPETATLDLNLFFSGSDGWTAESAPTDPEFQQVLEELGEIYAQVGIEIGEVAYLDVDEEYQDIADIMSGTGDFAELLTNSARAPLDGPSIFFVDRLRSIFDGGSEGGGVLGISGGIPGPVHVKGTVASGVAVMSHQIPGGPPVSHIFAHELGHYMGLFHTSEQNLFGGPQMHDPLPDTPQNDESYLMHATGGGDILSEWQGIVIRNNPWVKN